MVAKRDFMKGREVSSTRTGGSDSDWRDRAECLTEDPNLFDLPERTEAHTDRAKRALAVCARCLVQIECRALAESHPAHGVWGGRIYERGRVRVLEPPRSGES